MIHSVIEEKPDRMISIDDLATLVLTESNGEKSVTLAGKPTDIILLCVREGALMVANSFSNHPIDLTGGEGMWLAFPKGEWSTTFQIQPSSGYYLMRMDVKVFHTLLNPRFDHQQLAQASKMNMRDLTKRIAISPGVMMCFDQVFQHKLQPSLQPIFEKAKFFEIFSLLMDATMSGPSASCPVMITPAIENKLHLVRRHIVSHLAETPDPDQLALSFELPRNTLREGYRHVFGKTIHQYHADHKLEYAMQMLASGEWLVKEIAFRIGYQNPSHFIAAFKKKYGFTPKQYLKREAISA